MNCLRRCAEDGEIAAGIHDAAGCAETAQYLPRPIDREAFCNSSEVNPDIGLSKANLLPFKQLNWIKCSRFGVDRILIVRPGQQSHGLQLRRDGNIEHAV